MEHFGALLSSARNLPMTSLPSPGMAERVCSSELQLQMRVVANRDVRPASKHTVAARRVSKLMQDADSR